jgi:hypothetical protein
MKTRPIKWVVLPENEPIFSEQATTIEIVDEVAGEFLQVRQDESSDKFMQAQMGATGIVVDEYNWPEIKRAIDEAFTEIEKHKLDIAE